VIARYAFMTAGSGQCRLERNDEYGTYALFEDYERLTRELDLQRAILAEYLQNRGN
jgi:hypothetical protein